MTGVRKVQNLSRKKIINSAIILFASKGFDSTSTREICKHAGVNLSLISYYFKTKEGLYISIIESVLNYGLKFIQEEIEKSNEIGKMTREEKIKLLFELLDKYISFIYSESVPNNFVILMIKEQTSSNSKFSNLYNEKIQIFYKAFRKILASILGRTENDKTIIFQTSAIVAEILSFKFMTRAILTPLKQSAYTKEDLKLVRKIISENVKMSLEKLGIKPL
ncbi:MAG TPA: CerR family C-terminal domain-containing protein [Candidatus Gastranaerophilaceae bacterium]|nr:CerR family C-terminal domain-containing protein [Candidatus Gastranaerophilaceae bacterium]HPT41797.1 CerR family C-terminal domain-containing protein [Candidatus Gastranaerophilaceae bacterium]